MDSNFAQKEEQLKSLKNGRGINCILREGYRILENPIVMFDTSYNLLAYTEGIATDDRLWNEITTQGTFSLETVDFFNRENFIRDVARSEVVALIKSDKLKYDRADGKLFDKDGVLLANILVLACLKPFGEGDLELIETLCEILSAELQNSDFYHRIDRVYQESLLSELIEGTTGNHEIVMEKVAGLYDGLKSNLYLGVVDITPYDHTATHVAYFRDVFRRMQPEYKYYIHLHNIVAIISTDNARFSVKKDMRQLNDFLIKYGVYAGISGSFQDLKELSKYYREAICALNYGLKSERKQYVFRYDDIRVEHFVCSAKNAGDINRIYSPVIFSIQEYDKENDTSLLELLYTYLLYGKDAKLTCEHSGITQEELAFQIKKLNDAFEIEWENGDMLCNLFLSIKLLDCLPKAENQRSVPC